MGALPRGKFLEMCTNHLSRCTKLQSGGIRQTSPTGALRVRAMSSDVTRSEESLYEGSSLSLLQSWTVQPSFEVIPVQPQLVFLDPSISSPINPHLVGEKRSDSTNSLPTLNSYTKTALHPCKRDRVLDRGERGEISGQKWLCTDTAVSSKTSLLLSSACPQVPPDFKPAQGSTQRSSPVLMAGGKMSAVDGFQYISTDNPKTLCLSPLSPTRLHRTDCTSQEMQNPVQHMVQFATCSPPLAAEELYTSPELLLQQQSKRKRFQNTMVVLHRSGLLEITLKTKELIHQNQVTQLELDRLKQQTQLFMEAIKSNAPQAWAELEASLTGSDKADSSLEASPTYPNM